MTVKLSVRPTIASEASPPAGYPHIRHAIDPHIRHAIDPHIRHAIDLLTRHAIDLNIRHAIDLNIRHAIDFDNVCNCLGPWAHGPMGP